MKVCKEQRLEFGWNGRRRQSVMGPQPYVAPAIGGHSKRALARRQDPAAREEPA
jgi:hypothetical protein